MSQKTVQTRWCSSDYSRPRIKYLPHLTRDVSQVFPHRRHFRLTLDLLFHTITSPCSLFALVRNFFNPWFVSVGLSSSPCFRTFSLLDVGCAHCMDKIDCMSWSLDHCVIQVIRDHMRTLRPYGNYEGLLRMWGLLQLTSCTSLWRE